jgi:hypothetical protein
MSRKLILIAIALTMILSSLIARADAVTDLLEGRSDGIITNDAALKDLREETLIGLRSLLNSELTAIARLEKLSEITLKANAGLDGLEKSKQVNPADSLKPNSEFWKTFKVVSGAVALYSLQPDSNGVISARSCVKIQGVLMGNYILEPPPNNKPNELDTLLEGIRKLLCPNVK